MKKCINTLSASVYSLHKIIFWIKLCPISHIQKNELLVLEQAEAEATQQFHHLVNGDPMFILPMQSHTRSSTQSGRIAFYFRCRKRKNT